MQAQRNCNGVYTIYSPKVCEALGKLKHTFLSVVGQVASGPAQDTSSA